MHFFSRFQVPTPTILLLAGAMLLCRCATSHRSIRPVRRTDAEGLSLWNSCSIPEGPIDGRIGELICAGPQNNEEPRAHQSLHGEVQPNRSGETDSEQAVHHQSDPRFWPAE